MQDKALLSISIATYNRCNYVIELVNSIINNISEDIEIVVTDNLSQDDTVEQLNKIKDQRLKIFVNESNIGGANNVLKSIYNATGKYVLYCNDRDLICVEEIKYLMNFLKEGEYSFVATNNNLHTTKNKEATYYTSIFESFFYHKFIHHPTGMIFNRDIMDIHKLEYNKYADASNDFSCDFLARELFLCGNTAVYGKEIWRERDKQFIKNNKSNFSKKNAIVYFFPEARYKQYGDVMQQIYDLLDGKINKNEIQEILLACTDFYLSLIVAYKREMLSETITSHYGLNKQNISIIEIMRLCQKFKIIAEKNLNKNGKYDSLKEIWKKKYRKDRWKIIFKCIKIDINNILGRIK